MQGLHLGDNLIVELVPSRVALRTHCISQPHQETISEKHTWSYRLVLRNVRDGRLHPYGAILHAVHKATVFRPHVRLGYDRQDTCSYRLPVGMK